MAGECVVWRDEGFVVWLDAAVSCSCAVSAGRAGVRKCERSDQ